MTEYYTLKRCCLICDHAVPEDIDDLDNLIPCNCPENRSEFGGSPCMEYNDDCEYFVLNRALDGELLIKQRTYKTFIQMAVFE